jgi:hypothetical protein
LFAPSFEQEENRRVTDPALPSIISAAGALLVAVAGYVFTKRAERESKWREEKLAHYKEFVASLSGIMDNEGTPEGQIRFARACNDILLFAPQRVIEALDQFRTETRVSNTNKSIEKHDALLTQLLLVIRRDLGVRPADDVATFRAHLWASGVPSKPSSSSSPRV